MGLKYCGGCNPKFDRVGFVARLKKRIKGFEFVPYDDKEAASVLVVAGCEKACVDLSRWNGLPTHIITEERDTEALIDRINEMRGFDGLAANLQK